ncbi:MAG TPA: TIGR03435 family protein [Terracidiphilus sp.]|jgi:uncharacterized protein (TIGR03435 family)
MISHPGLQRFVCAAATLVLTAIPLCFAQSAASQTGTAAPAGITSAPSPDFDVAVIRPNPGDTTGHSHIWSSASDGNFKAQNVTAMELIRYAFGMLESRISGGPGWMRSARFDLEAKSDPAIDAQLRGLDSAPAREQKQHMLQALLADRFALKVHQETRELPIYALVVAKGGPRFQPSKINGTTINNGSSQITIKGSDHTLALLAEQLSRSLGRIVVDKTGLDGRYELSLKWTPDDAPAGAATASADTGPSIFTAIQEQLGLKLESGKGPVPILVIDHLDLPSQN